MAKIFYIAIGMFILWVVGVLSVMALISFVAWADYFIFDLNEWNWFARIILLAWCALFVAAGGSAINDLSAESKS